MGFFANLAEATDKLRDWTKGLHDANTKFAEFSGAMAGVQARQEMRDILLGAERGNRRAASAEYLATGMSDLERAFAPLEDSLADLKNAVTGRLVRGLARLVELMEPVAEWVAKIAGKIIEDSEKPDESLDAQFARIDRDRMQAERLRAASTGRPGRLRY